MNTSFGYITALEYRLKAATTEVMAFRSGEKYVKMQEGYQKELRLMERRIRKLEKELSLAHSETITVRNQWFEVFEELEKESARKLDISRKLNRQMEKRALEEERGKNLKLRAQINRDHENSSLPSSRSLKNKKISNSREKTSRRPGGQPGHAGHRRKKQVPTADPILLAPPQEVLDDPDFKKTSKRIVKQLVGIRLVLDVSEYHADVYYNAKTGERIHAVFPPGVVDDVNHAGSIKAFLFLLDNDRCTSIDKSRKFLSDLTGGKLNISKGMINKLSREFSLRSEQERKEMFADMLLSPVMHTDCTNAKVNGKSAYVFICATPDGKALYFARDKKGHEGVKGTPVGDFQGILIHDHEKTFYNYGTHHQECLAHILRYLRDSMDNEPDRTWNRQMRSLLQEMIHYRNSLTEEADPDTAKVSGFERRYRKVLQQAGDEYRYIPPDRYYRDGYNLYLRMEEYMANHLLFLHDHRIPATNNEAERLLRAYKRKQQQAVSFRSFENIDYLCQCMSMLVMMRQKEEINIFDRVSQIFG